MPKIFTPWNRQILYTGYDRALRDRILALLHQNKIPCRIKNRTAGQEMMHTRSQYGQLPQYQTTYLIYVLSEDLDEATFLLNQL